MTNLLYSALDEEEHGELISDSDLYRSVFPAISQSASSIAWSQHRVRELSAHAGMTPLTTLGHGGCPAIALRRRAHRWMSDPLTYEIAIPLGLARSRWLAETVSRIAALLDAKNEMGVQPIAERQLIDSITLLMSALSSDAAPPRVAALNDGGLQFDWHRGGLDVEVIVSPDPEESGIYVREKATGEEWEGPLDPNAFRAHVGDRLDIS
jgi:hypothetical protein